MNSNTPAEGRKGSWIGRAWRSLWARPAHYSIGAMLVTGFIGGLVFVGAADFAIQQTGTEEFCVSCHEMQQPFDEQASTVHFLNRTGTRAICADCHIPHALIEKIPAKITTGSKDILAHMAGALDTPQKFEERRLELAVSVWREMKDRDSKECRYCHQNVFTQTKEQFGGAARDHRMAAETAGLTCIDCHQGIAHHLPKGFKRPSSNDLAADGEAWLREQEAKLAASE